MTAAFPGDGARRWLRGERERGPGVGAERMPILSPGKAGVARAKAQARRVRAGHGQTRPGKVPPRGQGWGKTAGLRGPRRLPDPGQSGVRLVACAAVGPAEQTPSPSGWVCSGLQ